MISRMATTAKIPVAPALLSETKLYFQRKIKELQAWHEFPEDLIINFDQTPLSYVCTGKRTCHTQNASNVPLVGKAKKVNYRYLHNNYVWAVSTNASHLSREHRLLTVKTCRVCRWLDCHLYRANSGSNESKAIQHLRMVLFHMPRKGKLSLSCLKIKRPCLCLMFSLAKLPIKLVNLSNRITAWLHTSLIIWLINFINWI